MCWIEEIPLIYRVRYKRSVVTCFRCRQVTSTAIVSPRKNSDRKHALIKFIEKDIMLLLLREGRYIVNQEGRQRTDSWRCPEGEEILRALASIQCCKTARRTSAPAKEVQPLFFNRIREALFFTWRSRNMRFTSNRRGKYLMTVGCDGRWLDKLMSPDLPETNFWGFPSSVPAKGMRETFSPRFQGEKMIFNFEP